MQAESCKLLEMQAAIWGYGSFWYIPSRKKIYAVYNFDQAVQVQT
jgi:hypothetical protein